MKRRKHIFNSSWQTLTDDRANDQFEIYLGDVCHYPFELLPELRRLQTATVDVVYNGYRSTTYLIRETGNEYQCPMVKDEAKEEFAVKPLVFVISENNGLNFIERLKPPRFRVVYDSESKDILNVNWIDPEPSAVSTISILKKAKWFLEERVK